MEPVSPLGPVAELRPKKPLQFMLDIRDPVVIAPGAEKLFVVPTVLVTPFTVLDVTLPAPNVS